MFIKVSVTYYLYVWKCGEIYSFNKVMCFECTDTWRDESLRLSNVAYYVGGLGVKKTLLYIYTRVGPPYGREVIKNYFT